jgi:hypothetical protein
MPQCIPTQHNNKQKSTPPQKKKKHMTQLRYSGVGIWKTPLLLAKDILEENSVGISHKPPPLQHVQHKN